MKAFFHAFGSSVVTEWRALARFRPTLVMLLLIPVVYPLTVSWLYSADTAVERPAVVVDLDNSAASRTLTLWMDATRDVAVTERTDSIEKAWAMVQRRQVEVLVFIPEDFSTRIKQGRQATWKIWADAANIYTLGSSMPGVFGASGTLAARIGAKYLMARGSSPDAAAVKVQPVKSDFRNMFMPSGGYGDFLAPGILIMVIHQLVLICLGFSVGWQRQSGTIRPDESLPFTRMSGRLAAQLPFYVSAALFIGFVVMPLFGWPVTDSLALMAVFVGLILTLWPFAVLTVSLLPDHFAAFETLMFLSAPVFLMSGFTWPADLMPQYIRTISSVFPITPALLALRTVLVKTGDFSALVPYFLQMGVLAAAWTAVAVVLLDGRRFISIRLKTKKPVPSECDNES